VVIEAWPADAVRAAEAELLARLPRGARQEGALMQRAAAGLAVALADELRGILGRVTGSRVVLLVGGGDNGGDALFAGTRLHARGARVDVVQLASTCHEAGSAALARAGGRHHDVHHLEPTAALDLVAPLLRGADLVVDGIVGIGGSPGLRQPAATVVAALAELLPSRARIVAVDLPSGVDVDGGTTPAPHVTNVGGTPASHVTNVGGTPASHVVADVTVTFGAAKPCLLLPPASRAAGRVRLVELADDGLDLRQVLAGAGPAQVIRLSAADLADLWPVPVPTDDKYRRGVLGVICGSEVYPGAAVLAVGGALRAGAGLVRYLGPPSVTAAVLAAWPEVVAGEGRAQALLIGSGMPVPTLDAVARGQVDADDPSARFVANAREALEHGMPAVLDAGGLDLLVDRGGRGLVVDRAGAATLLTPHAGELAPLLTCLQVPTTRRDVEDRPYEHARRAAELTGATVLLKGSTTLVVDPDGTAFSQADGPSWLATAGSGDTLAGIAGALLAAGLTPSLAGALAAAVHGRAAARLGGPVTASDVAGAVPAVLAELLEGRPNG
jgi:ADP-dependent NAD(P)H-hydrate dehydratase / NAD(P)H-hydrate epimerase